MYYLYNEAGKDLGPITMAELKAKFDSGEISYDKLVRLAESKRWQPLHSILPEAATATPPPAPKQCPKCQSEALEEARKAPHWFLSSILGLIVYNVIYLGMGQPRAVGILAAVAVWVLVPMLLSSAQLKCTQCGHTWAQHQ
jgi:hypothetical protein